MPAPAYPVFTFVPARRAPRRAFTLIELMIVIGLIVALVAGASFALRGSGGSGLANAQNIVGSMVNFARAQAAVNQTEARLIFYNTRGTTDRDKYLRLCQVFIASPAGTTTFVPAGAPTQLPSGTFLVPPTITGLYTAAPGGSPWQGAALSVLGTGSVGRPPAGIIAQQTAGTPFGDATQLLYLQFNADGTVWTTTTAPTVPPTVKLVLTTGSISATNLPAFDNPQAIRGLVIRPSGAVSYVNDITGF